MAISILLNGAKGRMGQAIIAAANQHGATLAGAVDQGDDPADFISACDVIIDFSFHTVTPGLAALAAKHNKPIVIGTTGHNEAEKQAIRQHAANLPIVWAGNYSVGVTLLNHLVGVAAKILTEDYHPEIIEMHHGHKKDAPSGTAEKLLQVVLDARGWDASAARHGREGITGERPVREVGVHALRGGDVVGDHTVLFAGDGERLELTHKASDRKIFAQGAVRAAAWVIGQKPGLYGMEDVLGLNPGAL